MRAFFFALIFMATATATAGAAPSPGYYGAESCYPFGGKTAGDRAHALTAPHWDARGKQLAHALIERARAGRKNHCASPDFFRALSREVNGLLSYGREVDSRVFGRPDYWQTAGQTLTIKVPSTGERVADCEDYAVLKYWLAREAGCEESGLHVAVLRGKLEHHAVLVAEVAGAALRLDNIRADDGTDFLSPRGEFRSLAYLAGAYGQLWICAFRPQKEISSAVLLPLIFFKAH